MKRSKRILSLLLSIVMILGMLPMSALAANGAFSDVKTSDWFYDDVRYVCEKGLMDGTGSNTFSPKATTTRGMIVTILYRLSGEPAGSGVCPFSDVAAGKYYEKAIAWAAENRIVSGYADGTFGPDNAITREQFAAILYRYAVFCGYAVTASAEIGRFADADMVGSYALTAMKWASAEGLINGSGSKLDPKGSATRAQVAAILTRFCKQVVDKTSDTKTPATSTGTGWHPTPTPNPEPGKMYTVTFDANGSDVENLPAAQYVKAGECAVEPAEPTKPIHEFGGWYTDSECTERFSFVTKITADITLYAKWSIAIYSSPASDDHIKTGTMEYENEAFETRYIDNQIVIVIEDDATRNQLETLIAQYNGKIVGQIPFIGHYQVEFENKNYTIPELNSIIDVVSTHDFIKDAYVNTLTEMEGSAYSEYSNAWYPNDPYGSRIDDDDEEKRFYEIWNSTDISSTWGLRAGNVPQAWKLAKQYGVNKKINIGVIDGGFSPHKDLSITAYGEGYENGDHGNHVAGIIAASSDNKQGISGISQNARLLGTAVSKGVPIFELCTYMSTLIELNCNIINVSLGHKESNLTGLEKIRTSHQAGKLADVFFKYIDASYDFLVVTAAANNGEYLHDVNYANAITKLSEPLYKEHILVVGNVEKTQSDLSRCSSSAYVGNRVDVMAPGTAIYSTISNDGYGIKSGTSMASPFVAGVAVLIKEVVGSKMRMTEIREIILQTANIDVADSDVYMINAEAAMKEALRRIGVSASEENDTRAVELRFIDRDSPSKTMSGVITMSYTGYAGPHNFDLTGVNGVEEEYKLTNVAELNGQTNYGKIDIIYLNDGMYRIEFWNEEYSSGEIYLNITDDVDIIYIELSSNDTPPDPTPDPDPSDGFNITGTVVYLNDAEEEMPVSFAKCTLTDVTNNNIIYFAEVVDGKLSNSAFQPKPPAGTYLFTLEGGDADDNGFHSHKVIENVVIDGDLDLGKIYCDRVASVSCSVTNEDNEYLNHVGMTITQSGTTVTKIDSFYSGFDVELKAGLYTLTLTCDGYSPYTQDFTVNGTTELGTIILYPGNGFAGGDGSEANPYKVSTPEQLDSVRSDLTAHYVQINDIDMSGYGNFTPIGIGMPSYSTTLVNPVEFEPHPFAGTYDGGGYKITGLTISENTLDCVGLFSGCDENSIVKNVNLVNASLSVNKIGTDYTEQWKTGNIFKLSAGLISGYSTGSVTNCHVSGSISIINCNDATVGGIVGCGNVSSCTNRADIYVLSNKDSRDVDDGDVECGGIIGSSYTVNGATSNCINYGNVTAIAGNSAKAGGISGSNGALTYCVNYGNIKATVNYPNSYSSTYETASVGGIFGSSSSNNTSHCINLGSIEAYIYDAKDRYTNQAYVGGIGGLSGFYGSGIVTDCYNGGTNIIAVKYVDAESGYTEVEGNANRVIGALGGYLDKNKNNYSLDITRTNGKIPSDQLSDTENNGETIAQDAFDEVLQEILNMIAG